MIIKKEIVDSLFAQFGESDITQLSIREVGKLVAQIEQQSGQEFIHMEMGVPGLPASSIAIEAEKHALDTGLAAQSWYYTVGSDDGSYWINFHETCFAAAPRLSRPTRKRSPSPSAPSSKGWTGRSALICAPSSTCR